MRTHPADREPAPDTAVRDGPIFRTVVPAGRFLAELGGMCAVMCVGGIVLSFASFGIASLLGYPDLALRTPELSVAIITVCLAVPMAVYMAVRGHGGRHNVEMTGSTIAVGIVVMGLLWFGVLSPRDPQQWQSLFGLVCGPACMIMIVQMLLTFKTYSGRAHHHRSAG